jgi:exonuclease III
MFKGGQTKAPVSLSNLILCLLVLINCADTTVNLNWNLPLTVSSINCNSLNMSSTGSFNHKLKMYGITKLRTDIIFMCDIRLSNPQNVTTRSQAELTFRTNPYGAYEFYCNSTRNKRGVGILIKKNSDFRVLEEKRDTDENIIVLRLLHQGSNRELLVSSVYGPNWVEPLFFNNLRHLLGSEDDVPIIVGGDWNCTYSSETVRNKIRTGLNSQTKTNIHIFRLIRQKKIGPALIFFWYHGIF